MDNAFAGLGSVCSAIKYYIWRENENGSIISGRKKAAGPCSLNGAAAASFKLDQNYFLIRFILQTELIKDLFQ
jgi:hypothetical protein